MLAKPIRLEEISVFRGFPAKIALIAGLMPALLPVAARAQVNIDAGKSSAEIYASDCATCHKTPRGLAAGKNSLMLSSFLREHYTASRDQASALAAYVLGAGGSEPGPKPKPEVEHARAEEAKPGEPKAEPKPGETRASEAKPGQPKTAAHPIRAAAKPEEKRATVDEAKQEQHQAPAATEDRASETASREPSHGSEEAAPAVPAPPPVSAAPAPREPPGTAAARSTPSSATVSVATGDGTRSDLPSLELGSSLDAKPPAEDQPSVAATVPRDNIPD
jgi:hypothetical protein